MAETHERQPIRILSYCVLSNHWHFVAWLELSRLDEINYGFLSRLDEIKYGFLPERKWSCWGAKSPASTSSQRWSSASEGMPRRAACPI